jgi:DNA-directed RNA polymerase specialized sigma subunit
MIRILQKKLKYDPIPHGNEADYVTFGDESNALSNLIESEVMTQKEKIYLQKLNQLTKRQRFLFTERFINEKSVEEIMKEQNLARQTVYNMIHRSINILKEA